MLNEKEIDKFESLPKRLRVGHEYKLSYYYDDNFKKSAAEQYHLGGKYFQRCAPKFIDKPAKDLIKTLREKCKKSHRSFKKAVEECIQDDLIKNDHLHYISSLGRVVIGRHCNSAIYVDSKGIVRDLHEVLKLVEDKTNILFDRSNFKERYPEYAEISYSLYDLKRQKNTPKLSKLEGGTFPFVLRYQGLMYYVTNTELEYIDINWYIVPKLSHAHYVVRTNAINSLQLLKIDKKEMKYLNLVDIKENFNV